MADGNRVTIDWMGQPIEALRDLLRPGLLAVCVGINPSPDSVSAGRYYQGTLGLRLLDRLRQVGLLSPGHYGMDDAAFESGIGFTDIVKRPTPRAKDLEAKEFEYGGALLERKLRAHAPRLIIFMFKDPAVRLLSPFKGCGFESGRSFAGGITFIMPGPYAKRGLVDHHLETLRAWLESG